MILVAVGTFIHGFDDLVLAADTAAAALGLPGFAQIGHSRVTPRHLAWARFLPPDALAGRIAAARLVICHGGIGILGEAMRAGRPIVAMPRRGRPTRSSPAGDQTALLQRLARQHPIHVCERPGQLAAMVQALVAGGLAPQPYDLGSDIPSLIMGFLTSSRSGRRRFQS